MVVPSPVPARTIAKKTKSVAVPAIDLSLGRSIVSELVVNACERYGFFKVINHGVDRNVTSDLEEEGFRFFAKSMDEKQMAAEPPSPFGYGRKNIGFLGDVGEVEYLLLRATPSYVLQSSETVSDDPLHFSGLVNDYVKDVKELSCEILDLIGEGLGLSYKHVFSDYLKDVQSDSCLRFNYYPVVREPQPPTKRIGFGEHSDPQIMTLLRSNDVPGLQICRPDGTWVPVPPDPTAYYVIIGDSMEALTNGRFKGLRHRAIIGSAKPRMSTMFFCAPPLDGWITPLPEMVSPLNPAGYKPFTWGEYKRAAYAHRLGHNRIDLFKISL